MTSVDTTLERYNEAIRILYELALNHDTNAELRPMKKGDNTLYVNAIITHRIAGFTRTAINTLDEANPFYFECVGKDLEADFSISDYPDWARFL